VFNWQQVHQIHPLGTIPDDGGLGLPAGIIWRSTNSSSTLLQWDRCPEYVHTQLPRREQIAPICTLHWPGSLFSLLTKVRSMPPKRILHGIIEHHLPIHHA
jgi:hypothetical protein